MATTAPGQRIRIRLRSYDHAILDQSAGEIVAQLKALLNQARTDRTLREGHLRKEKEETEEARLLAEEREDLEHQLAELCRLAGPKGVLILSGFKDTQEDELRAGYEQAGWNLETRRTRDEWVIELPPEKSYTWVAWRLRRH